MPFHDWSLFGYKAHLVLEDEHGEFEVRYPLAAPGGRSAAALNLDRIAEAVSNRQLAVAPRERPKRPVY